MPSRPTFHLIPHTHWDREWYLPRAAFQARLAAAGIDLATLLANDPGSRFVLDGQTVLVEDLLAIHPQLEEPFAAAITQGRLEVGPWYILGDELIPSGESLIRNLLQGARDCARLGRRMDVLYSPDAFSHPAILPTLAAQFGIPFGVVWRGLAPLGEDADLYRWIGPDGGAVMLYHLPASGYEVGSGLLDAGGQLAARWRTLREPLVARAETNHIPVFLGADHHAPPRDLQKLRDRLALFESGVVRVSSLSEFFSAVSTTRDRLPTVQGELRWSYGYTWTLQGVHATRARLKRRFASTELQLARRVEPLAALAQSQHGLEQRGILRNTWRALLQAQFHDTLCGCCTDDVAAEQDVRLRGVQVVADEMVRGSIEALSGHNPDAARAQSSAAVPTLLLWNPAARTRGGIATAVLTVFRRDVLVGPPSKRSPRVGRKLGNIVLTAPGGRKIPVQVLGVVDGTERLDARRHYPDQDEVDRITVAFNVDELAGCGISWVRPTRGVAKPTSRGMQVSAERLANRWVEVISSRTGGFTLVDKRTGTRYSKLLRLEDERDEGDAYTPLVPPAGRVSREVTFDGRRVLAAGPLVGAVESRFRLRAAAGVILKCRAVLVLHADSPLVRVTLDIHNTANNHRLRARFPVGTAAHVVAGAAFGYERRDTDPPRTAPTPMEAEASTAPAQRYVAAETAEGGLALFLPGFFEYEWTGRDLMLTLVRSIGELSRGDLPTRPGHAGWPTAIPGAQEPGLHRIEFALAAVESSSAISPRRLESMWEDAFLPITGSFIRDFVGDVSRLRNIGATLKGTELVFTGMKPAESGSGIVLRCVNLGSRAAKGSWQFAGPIDSAILCRADETPLEALNITDRREVAFTAPPRAIVTIIVQREKDKKRKR